MKEIYETPEDRYNRLHSTDGAAKERATKIFKKIFLDEKNFESLKQKRERVKELKAEAKLKEEEKELDTELSEYKKENKRVKKMINDFKNGGAKSSSEWRDAMKGLKDAKGFGDIVPAAKTKRSDDSRLVPMSEPEVVIIEETEKKEEEPISIW